MCRQCVVTLGPIYTKRKVGAKAKKIKRQARFRIRFTDVNEPLNIFPRFRFKADYISFSHSFSTSVNASNLGKKPSVLTGFFSVPVPVSLPMSAALSPALSAAEAPRHVRS